MNKYEVTIAESAAFVDAHYSGVQIVEWYMGQRSDLIEKVEADSQTVHRVNALKGLWLRARAWVQTMNHLNHTRYFQALAAGNRALLEFAVDIILLHHDKSNTSGWKIFQWSQSEKLKAAETIVNFFKPNSPPDQFEAQTNFYAQQKTFIEGLRKALWGVVKHPPRWTGRSDLFRDIVEADTLSGPIIQDTIGISLARYYRTEYRKLNWFIHSGAAAYGGLPPPAFNLIAADLLKWSADLAMLSTKTVLVDFGFKQTLKLDDEWDEVARKRRAALIEKMRFTEKGGKG